MEKTIKKVVIDPESVDVISNTNGISNITQLSLEPRENEIQQIFEKYSLAKGVIYHYDEKIVRALGDNKEQLTEYLETCRRSSYPNKKVDVPDTIPEIEYDLRELRNGFLEIEDEDLRKMKQIEMYKKAKEVQDMLGKKVVIKIGILLKAYLSVQELLQNRSNKSNRLLLNPGIAEERVGLRKRLYNPKYTEITNEVSREYNSQESQIETQIENEEMVK